MSQSPVQGAISADTQLKVRTWYRYQTERENIQTNIQLLQEKLQTIREKQEPIEEDIIDNLENTHNTKRPLQIGNDWFGIKAITCQDTPLTYTSLEKILLSYFGGDIRRRDDCINFIKNQREQRNIRSRIISRIAPSPHSPLSDRTLSTISNIES